MRDDSPTPSTLLAPVTCIGLPAPLARPPGTGDAQADPFAPLLCAVAPPAGEARGAPGALRRRLLERVTASAAAARTLHTRRHADTVPEAVQPGVTLRRLYDRSGWRLPARAPRSGEPEAVTLVELAPGASWNGCDGNPTLRSAGPQALQQAWLVLRGMVRIGEADLQAHDYHVVPAGAAAATISSATGALLYHRRALPAAGAPAQPITRRAGGARWDDYAPGIKRRLLWQQGPQAAMLYHALPGAGVPHHGHDHDEECLMLAGEFFLAEVLLRPLDYQIAPAGSEHHVSSTDTGVLIYSHGDVQLALK